MARNTADVFAFLESLRNVTSRRASKKIRTQIVMPTKRPLTATADAVVDVRLLKLEPLEGSVAVRDIPRTTRGCEYKRFSRCSLFRSRRALYSYFETYCSTPFDSGEKLLAPIQMKPGGGISGGHRRTGHQHGTENVHYTVSSFD